MGELAPHFNARDVPGPRPPEYPGFERYNTAVHFDGSGAHFAMADPGAGSPLDFTNGDVITLEAWVQVAAGWRVAAAQAAALRQRP